MTDTEAAAPQDPALRQRIISALHGWEHQTMRSTPPDWVQTAAPGECPYDRQHSCPGYITATRGADAVLALLSEHDPEAAAHDQSKSPHKPGSSMWCRGCITEGRTPASMLRAPRFSTTDETPPDTEAAAPQEMEPPS